MTQYNWFELFYTILLNTHPRRVLFQFVPRPKSEWLLFVRSALKIPRAKNGKAIYVHSHTLIHSHIHVQFPQLTVIFTNHSSLYSSTTSDSAPTPPGISIPNGRQRWRNRRRHDVNNYGRFLLHHCDHHPHHQFSTSQYQQQQKKETPRNSSCSNRNQIEPTQLHPLTYELLYLPNPAIHLSVSPTPPVLSIPVGHHHHHPFPRLYCT